MAGAQVRPSPPRPDRATSPQPMSGQGPARRAGRWGLARRLARSSVLERLQVRDEELALAGELRRDLELRAQLLVRLVDQKPLGLGDGCLEQRPAGCPHVDRLEVPTILSLGDVSE